MTDNRCAGETEQAFCERRGQEAEARSRAFIATFRGVGSIGAIGPSVQDMADRSSAGRY